REYASNTIFHGSDFDVSVSGKARGRDIWGDETYSTENLIAYRDYFVRRTKRAPGIRFINATEGGILAEGVEILSLKDALNQACVRLVDAASMFQACHRPSKTSADALRHLRHVLQHRRTDCNCLSGFLELSAKKHVLKKNELEIEKTILWGVQTISDFESSWSRATR
ncbi:MAG TPA: hypothetical protein VER98_14035, partial [Terriglobia bacterium]|nr:hypothetical protein [Terriglobia bacterium]